MKQKSRGEKRRREETQQDKEAFELVTGGPSWSRNNPPSTVALDENLHQNQLNEPKGST